MGTLSFYFFVTALLGVVVGYILLSNYYVAMTALCFGVCCTTY